VSKTSDVWRLDLSKLRWERMPSLGCIRTSHACCAVRAGVVVLGGYPGDVEGRNEILEHDSVEEEEHLFKVLPPLSARGVLLRGLLTIPLAIDESQSVQGQVVIIRERGGEAASSSVVQNVDLATGVCTPLPPLLYHHGISTVVQLRAWEMDASFGRWTHRLHVREFQRRASSISDQTQTQRPVLNGAGTGAVRARVPE